MGRGFGPVTWVTTAGDLRRCRFVGAAFAMKADLPGRGRLTDAEIAEIRRRRLGARASLACEGMYLTAEDEAVFEQMDGERLTPDERARRIIEVSRAKRRRKAVAST
jgi:hypothetical protein